MKNISRGMLPIGASIPDNVEEIEYSFAIEYQGPPLTDNLPRAIPVDVKSIPVASVVSLAYRDDKSSLPVVQPLIGLKHLKKKLYEEVELGSEFVVSPSSVIAFDESRRAGSDSALSGECSSSGQLEFQKSSEMSEVMDKCETLGSSNDCQCSNELSRTESTGSIESRGNNNHSGASVSSSSSQSFEISSQAEEESGVVNSRHVRRASVVTFRDEDSVEIITDQSSSIESEHMVGRKEPGIRLNKGSCYQCFRRNRFTEKEACIVCNAKYCVGCVLGAMGSMPEGRKCLSCIGCPIDESKRSSLGKCSRMLRRLLSELEIRQIMNVEKLCEANQLQAKHVYVNGKRLSQEELILLQSCPHPPTKLKPGCYWYDKVSGLWGKEGQKPSKIISSHLNVGGNIAREASNGNTNVLVNNREITKAELRLLKLAGAQCAGSPHFWLDANGSYQEEGQKNVNGRLWDKAATKLYCAVMSLPVPSSKVANSSAEEVHNLVSGAIPEYLKQRTIQKLLLVGYNGSGTSTIFKQAKMLYKDEPFSEDERQDLRFMIQKNVYIYLAIVLEGREQFEDESLAEMRRKQLLDQPDFIGNANEGNDKSIYSISSRLKAFSDWLLKIMVSGNLDAIFPAASREYAPLVEELWKDVAIQATFDRRSELKLLPRVASYFLERVVDILRTDYKPSDMDILYAEGISSSNGIACTDFSFPRTEQQGSDAFCQPNSLLRYQLIRVDARSLGEHCKWLDMFEDVRMVIFCVALTDYDQFTHDSSGVPTNKVLASRKLFEDIITHPTFKQTDFLLILTKYDLLGEKIEHVPLSECSWFSDFNLMVSNHPSSNNNYIASPAEQAFHYIAAKFKKLFHSLTERKLYVSLVNGLEPDTIKESLTYAREILKWDEERIDFNIHDSSYTETATYSR